MMRQIDIAVERFPIAGSFAISRGAKTEAAVVTVKIAQNGSAGRGECVPYARYGESIDSVVGAVESVQRELAAGLDRQALLDALPAGAARNAIDCALWDLEAKLSGVPAHLSVCKAPPRAVATAMTISFGTPQDMAARARKHADWPLLKVKVGGDGDIERIRAVAAAAPSSRIILDANEGWTADNIADNLLAAARHRVALVEQPLPAGEDAILDAIPHPVPICADESIHTTADLDALVGRYEVVNIKLDKTGGLTAALGLQRRAKQLGFGTMIGCMVGTSLAMAPAVLLAQEADFVDLDGPLLLARDRSPGLAYAGAMVSPPQPGLWG